MSSHLKSETQIKILSPQNNFVSSPQNFKQDSQRNTEFENVQIAHSMSNSVNNLTPMKLQQRPRKISGNQLSVSRTENMIIQCQICENLDDMNLIQPCQCENFYHSTCFKKKLLATTGPFTNDVTTCSNCGIAYKIRKIEAYHQKNFSKLTELVSFLIRLIITLGGLSGLSYWFYKEVQHPEEMSSLVAIIVLLILLLVLYLVYMILELVRGNVGVDWEILDQRQDIDHIINPEELNLIENRGRDLSNSQRPQVIQHIANVQYPQISTSEIIQ
ncbi:unnamed protein product [Paramecium octaurelia]|uniref:RING-CH-type domain-containing protein n=1 Tax=Paramecium octaurelia TaxID=43137 RepID=A0A8S1WK05_PAROT|nr:unnamed protein product [Paramecium octaurelia]